MTAPLRIAVAEGTFAGFRAGPQVIRGTEVDLQVVPLNSAGEVAQNSAGVDGMILGLQRFGKEEIAGLAPSVRVISRAGIGLDSIDLDAARNAGIAVAFQPDYATAEVASHAVAMLLAVNRRLTVGDRIARNGWKGRRAIGLPRALSAMSVGVVGAGAIGRAAIARIAPLVGRVIVHDPAAPDLPPGAERAATLNDLLSACDAVTLHAPLLPQTRHMIGAVELALMPRGSILVNVSRGELVDTAALVDALTSGHLAGAGLDVFEQEPVPADHPLAALESVILSPHVAFLSDLSVERLERQALEDAVSFITEGAVHGGKLAVRP